MYRFIILILSLLFFFFSSCSHSNFKIEGKVQSESLNGEYVFLKTLRNNILLNIDSTIVENDRFVFSGHIDTSRIVEITFPSNEKLKIMPLVFVLNPGRTRCVIDTLSYASGEENVKLHNYYLNKRIIENKINSLSEEYNYYVLTNKLNDSLDFDFKAELGFLNRQSNELDYNFIYANNDNNAGAFIFLQSYSVLSKQQILDILTTATDNFKSLPEIEIISNQFYSENQSSVGMPYINAYLLDSLNQKIPISYYVNKNFWVLLNFWRSDCQPCVDELPYLKEIYENYAPRGLIILGISLDKSSSLWLYTLEHDNALWPQFCDFKGWDSDIVKKYGVCLLPFNLLINPAGTIVLRGDRQGALSQKLKEIFQE